MKIFLSGSVPLIIVIIALFQKIEWRRHIKEQARSYFQEGAWIKFALCLTVSVLGTMIVTVIVGRFLTFFAFLVPLFGMSMISYGTIDVMHRIRRGQEFVLRDFFPTDQLGSVVGLYFIKGLYLFFWSLLLAVPGIIKSYEYRMVPYILAENPGMDSKQVFEISKRMMNGQKMETFILDLSFIGWALVAGITCGIAGVFYVTPYVNATNTELYAFNKVQAYNEGYIR